MKHNRCIAIFGEEKLDWCRNFLHWFCRHSCRNEQICLFFFKTMYFTHFIFIKKKQAVSLDCKNSGMKFCCLGTRSI